MAKQGCWGVSYYASSGGWIGMIKEAGVRVPGGWMDRV